MSQEPPHDLFTLMRLWGGDFSEAADRLLLGEEGQGELGRAPEGDRAGERSREQCGGAGLAWGAARLRELAADAPTRVCSRTFSCGDVIWKCRTCSIGDDTCVVCQVSLAGSAQSGTRCARVRPRTRPLPP
eukprot:scaffold202456_cov28-Tisochrysis_lutea.AAC.10